MYRIQLDNYGAVARLYEKMQINDSSVTSRKFHKTLIDLLMENKQMIPETLNAKLIKIYKPTCAGQQSCSTWHLVYTITVVSQKTDAMSEPIEVKAPATQPKSDKAFISKVYFKNEKLYLKIYFSKYFQRKSPRGHMRNQMKKIWRMLNPFR